MTNRKTRSKNSSSSRPSRIVLGESLDFHGIARLHTRLLDCAAKKKNVDIKADRVEHIDTASLQALVSFVSMIGANGNSVRWVSPSTALVNAANIAGLHDMIDLDDQPAN